MNTEFGQRVLNSLVASQTLQKEAKKDIPYISPSSRTGSVESVRNALELANNGGIQLSSNYATDPASKSEPKKKSISGRLSGAAESANKGITAGREAVEKGVKTLVGEKATKAIGESRVGKAYSNLSKNKKNLIAGGATVAALGTAAYGAKKLFGKKKEKKDEKEARAEAAFEQGFLDKCAEYKLDPEQVAEYISNNTK